MGREEEVRGKVNKIGGSTARERMRGWRKKGRGETRNKENERMREFRGREG